MSSPAVFQRLSDCTVGETVKIVRVGGQGAFRKRLLEMGFMRGGEVSIVRYAPLKDPIAVSVRGSIISLRVVEASDIEVEAL